jgi:hypothetical protein
LKYFENKEISIAGAILKRLSSKQILITIYGQVSYTGAKWFYIAGD